MAAAANVRALLALAVAAAASASSWCAEPGHGGDRATVRVAKPAPNLKIVDQNGVRKSAPEGVTLQQRTHVVTKPSTVGEVLQQHGLAKDANTVEMVKRLNPGVDVSKDKLPQGAKIELFAPKTREAGVPAQRFTFDSPRVARLAVQDNVVAATKVSAVATQLPRAKFDSEKTFARHRAVTSDIDHAGQVLLDHADAINPTDLAVARYVLDSAVRRAADVNTKGVSAGQISGTDVQALERAAAPTRTMAKRLEAGQTPLPLRRVKVSVVRADSNEDVKGLQVYVLPAGIVDSPASFTDAEIQDYLTRFSFVGETSPVSQEVPLFDARVWVGPKFKSVEMARLVKQHELRKFLAINDPILARPNAELVFRAPADIVNP